MSLQTTMRPVIRDDEPFLWEMLYYAAHIHDEPGKTVQDAQQDAFLVKYVRDWGRPGDMGFIAVENETDTPIGAAWVRLYASSSNPYSQVDENIPELAIG